MFSVRSLHRLRLSSATHYQSNKLLSLNRSKIIVQSKSQWAENVSSRRSISSLHEPYDLEQAPKSVPPVADSSYLRHGDESEFLRLIRKPPDFFNQVVEGIKSELRHIPAIQDISQEQASRRKIIHEHLTAEERKLYLKTIYTNMCFSRPVSSNFAKSALALPTMGSSIYSHVFAGLTNYVLKKRASMGLQEHDAQFFDTNLGPGFRSENGSKFDYKYKVPVFYRTPLNLATYYRTPILVEELERMGLSEKDYYAAISKAFFLQYHAGAYETDDQIFNPLIRVFYPQGKHIITGANDLGRETDFQAAKLYSQAYEGIPNPPLTIINYGDTGPFTDGHMHAMQHVLEARERNLKMPMIFLVNANNSSISSRLAFDSPEESVQKIVDRFQSYGNLMVPGQVSEAEDTAAGIQAIRKAVDDVLETGRPTYVITHYPFRPLGHASDGHPGSDMFLLHQFDSFTATLLNQITTAAEIGQSGSDLADDLAHVEGMIESSVKRALTGNIQLTRPQINELSIPGSSTENSDRGQIVDLDLNYLLGKGSKGFAGLGAEIYSKSMDRLMTRMENEGRECRYVHQENHQPGTKDTRGGVYGELNGISDRHLLKNFVAFLPHEAQVAQIGAGLRVSLPENNLVFVKGPHTIFNEHARDHMKYAAFRHYDSGECANYIYIMDGGSLAAREIETVMQETIPDSEVYDKPVERDIVLARVGEHHNTNEYSCYSGDPNTVCAVPIDMNFVDRMLPEMVNLHDKGRLVCVFAPTASFGQLHSNIELLQSDGKPSKAVSGEGTRGITMNDIVKVNIPGKLQPTRKLIVIAWGPDTKWIAKTLKQHDLECTMLILCYDRLPNSLVSYFEDQVLNHDSKSDSDSEIEVLLVEQNPEASLMGPVVNKLKRELGHPQNVIFSECTVDPRFVPYGLGTGLLSSTDLTNTLQERGLLIPRSVTLASRGGLTVEATKTSTVSQTSSSNNSPKTVESESIYAPIEAEKAIVKLSEGIKIGQTVVSADQVIAELETDKAAIEITAPFDGILLEMIVEDGQEVDVTTDTELFKISSGSGEKGSDSSSSSSEISSESDSKGQQAQGQNHIVCSPVETESATIIFKKQVGDTVSADEIVAELETDKAAIELCSPVSGIVEKFSFENQSEIKDVKTDTVLFTIKENSSSDSDSGRSIDSSKSQGGSVTPSDTSDNGAGPTITPLPMTKKGMAKNMMIQPGDTFTFAVSESVPFESIKKYAKSHGAAPAAALVKILGDAIIESGTNKKLNPEKDSVIEYGNTVNLGLAVEVNNELRVAVVRNVREKSIKEVQSDIERFVKLGKKLPTEDQDLTDVCYVLTTLGKDAPEEVLPVLPRSISAILGIGRAVSVSDNAEEVAAKFTLNCCHATLNGSEGARLLMKIAEIAKNVN